MENTILEYNFISIDYDGVRVVEDVSFSLNEGEILGIIGESGSGKSTIVRAAMGLLGANGKVISGDIRYKGESLLNKSEKQMGNIRGAEIGMIFQDAAASLCPIRTIGAQIIECMHAKGREQKAEVKNQALSLFAQLNFRNGQKIWNSYPFELSGGMNQRVAVALAMLQNPKILLADEATSALDNISRNQVLSELVRLYDRGTAMIIVTHDMDIAKVFCSRVLELRDGKLIESAVKS